MFVLIIRFHSVFSMNHTHRPVAPQHSQRDWVTRAVEYTTNCHPSMLTHWLTGYLCYQVEHHLFPNIPHPRLPYVAPRVKALLKKHNVLYDCRSMDEAMATVSRKRKPYTFLICLQIGDGQFVPSASRCCRGTQARLK